MITADGEQLTATADGNPDLLWALRGGGGNFGVVTSFEYQLHPIGPEVIAGGVVHSFADAPEVFRFFADYVDAAPDELSVTASTFLAPPGFPVPSEMIGELVTMLAVCYAGDIAEGERILKPLRSFGRPLADLVATMPYTALQSGSDASYPNGQRNYWKSHYVDRLTDDVIATVMEHAQHMRSPLSSFYFQHLGGAIDRAGPDVAAFGHRGAGFDFTILTVWKDPAEDAGHMAWARDFFTAMEPYSTGVYVNNLGSEGAERVKAAYAPETYERLAELKRTYDPDNVFSVNQTWRRDTARHERDAADQDEGQEQDEPDAVDNQAERADHATKAKALNEQQDPGEDRDPPEPAWQQATLDREHARCDKRKAAEDVAHAVDREGQVVQRVGQTRIVLRRVGRDLRTEQTGDADVADRVHRDHQRAADEHPQAEHAAAVRVSSQPTVQADEVDQEHWGVDDGQARDHHETPVMLVQRMCHFRCGVVLAEANSERHHGFSDQRDDEDDARQPHIPLPRPRGTACSHRAILSGADGELQARARLRPVSAPSARSRPGPRCCRTGSWSCPARRTARVHRARRRSQALRTARRRGRRARRASACRP